MKIYKYLLVTILCCVAFSFSAYAKSPVWKISKGGNHVFLGGTIHLLGKSDFPLPEAFESAYSNSMILVLEADIQKFSEPEFQTTVLQSTMYPGDQNITQFLKQDTLQALEAHLNNRGIPMEPLLKLKPGMLSITLMVVELQRMGLAGTGVDEYFHSKALNENRDIAYLETAADQLAFLSKLGEGYENELVRYTLNDLNSMPKIIADMKAAWRNGDNAGLEKVALAPWQKRFPKIYHSLLVERNNDWVPQIEAMLNTKEVELVLFGAAHLVGEDGILDQLKALGCNVENL